MPTYEYRCRECGHDLEAQQSFDDDPLTTCPACGGPLRKVFGNVGISFKGSGFYKTDSRSSGNGGSSSGSSSSSSSGSSSDSGGDATPSTTTTSTSSSSSGDSSSSASTGTDP